ncbi:UNVERIFIED_CONTAM: Thaumatin-like protein 1 [Sesamum radiatum]|uniref:Thaumatin-like protein 1 n=1 Tax=Sesamum radiatum TaxID=300843 RepID=A0AAW2VQX4_SESRA
MAGAHSLSLSLFFSSLILSLSARSVFSATFTLVNRCSYTVWPGILSNAGTPQLSTTGFALNPGDSFPISAPASWSGRMWGRTLCSQDSTTGKFTCVTGDCGSGALECGGGGAAPPATLAEFTLNGADGLDFYDVSLVDGYNLPMLVVPQGGTGGNCSNTGCVVELNASCPSELQVLNAVSTSAGRRRRRTMRGLQERLRGVRRSQVLLQRRVRDAGYLQAEHILGVL